MKNKWREHIIVLISVTTIFIFSMIILKNYRNDSITDNYKIITPFLKSGFIDFNNSLHRAIFKESIQTFYNGDTLKINSTIRAMEWYRIAQFTDNTFKTGAYKPGITSEKILKYSVMYFIFIIIYISVLSLVYFLSISLGTYFFIKEQSQVNSVFKSFILGILAFKGIKDKKYYFSILKMGLKLLGSILLYLVLFSPSYVVAYSFKSGFDTGYLFFIVIFAVISNGLLITFANKFYHILQSESKKGYYETARVKNLSEIYDFETDRRFSLSSIFRFKFNFAGHVFNHIFINARFQYLLSLKELSLFLITGLIIIEMALNVQGHLFYQMLQDTLNRDYEMVLLTVFAVFLVIKGGDILVDYIHSKKSLAFENKDV